MKVIGVDFYNQTITGDAAMPIRATRGDTEHIPCVVTLQGGITTTIDASYYKGQGMRAGIEREYIVIAKKDK